MSHPDIRALLEAIRQGQLSVDEDVAALKPALLNPIATEDLGFARLDHQR